MVRGTVAVLDNGNASYERVAWTEKGDGLSVLKGTDDRALRDKRYAVARIQRLRRGRADQSCLRPGSRQDLSRRHDDQPEP